MNKKEILKELKKLLEDNIDYKVEYTLGRISLASTKALTTKYNISLE